MNANVFAQGCGVSRPAVRLKPLTFLILLSLFSAAVQAEDITEFNTEVLDLNERGDIDLSQFSQAGYVMPGTYSLALKINNSMLAERQIRFLAPDNDPQGSMALMNPLMILVKIIKLRWIHILSYDQMVSRKINNQTTRCANSIF
ncbi:FimD/PapC N-terminal domain-containing protein, partial [Morganella morganii]